MKVCHRFGVGFAFVAVIAGASFSGSGGAFAQAAQSCSCLAAMPVAGSAVGVITQVSGDVRMSQAGGYAPVKGEAPVYSGARIMTGAQASAALSVGANCALDVPANATVKVDPVEGGMCVSLNTPEATVVPTSSGPGLVPVLLGGGAVGGAAALILSLHDDDNSVSR